MQEGQHKQSTGERCNFLSKLRNARWNQWDIFTLLCHNSTSIILKNKNSIRMITKVLFEIAENYKPPHGCFE